MQRLMVPSLMVPSLQMSLRPLAQQAECGEDCEVTMIATAQDNEDIGHINREK